MLLCHFHAFLYKENHRNGWCYDHINSPKLELLRLRFAFSLPVLQICRPLSLKGQIQKNRERKPDFRNFYRKIKEKFKRNT